MKKAEDIKVGDIPYLYCSIDGFKPLSKISSISKPDNNWPVYRFELSGDYPRSFNIQPNVLYSDWDDNWDNNWSETGFIIVPESKEEIDLLNSLLKCHYKFVQSDIQCKLKNILGL